MRPPLRLDRRHGPTCVLWLLATLTALGCTQADATGGGQHGMLQQEQQQMGKNLFASAIELLKQTEQFDPRSSLRQVTDRLNQWLRTATPPSDWHVDPLVAELSEEYRHLAALQDLSALKFEPADGPRLRETVWLRDIAQNIAGRESDPLERAKLLLDWTTRNIQLEPSDAEHAFPQVPWETLAIGRGQAVDRAWVFALLARQAGHDVVLLGTNDQPADVRLAALWNDGELYLFDTALGLPIPGPDGTGVATLAEAIANPAVLEQLTIDDFSYPLKADDLKQATALVEASPLYLEQRARAIEEQLAGGDRMILSIDASALVEELQTSRQVADAGLWTLPYQREAERAAASQLSYLVLAELLPVENVPDHLWKGRALHLMGRYVGDPSATNFYQSCRPSDQQIDNIQLSPSQILDPALGREQLELFKRTILRLKQDASYWLGLIAYERGSYDTAINYFAERTLAAFPDGAWTDGAHYNLARSYEALDRTDDAVAELRKAAGPQRHGNLLRARQLEKSAAR